MAGVLAALDRVALGLASAGVLLMTLLGGLDVLATVLFNRPIPTTYEATETLMVLVVFLSLAHLQRTRTHVAIDLVAARMSPRHRRAMAVVADALAACFFGLVAWTGWQLAWHSFSVGEYAAGLVAFPIYPSKVALALGATLASVQAMHGLGGRDDGPRG
jgi:TRAP-type C4-dicarboxylate transport system permease small subunit